MKQTILLLFYVFLSHSSAQTKVSSDESFDELLQSYSKFIYKDASKALTYALKARGIAVVNANNEQLAQVFYCISKCHYKLGENKIALQNIKSAISKAVLFKDAKLLYNCFCLKGDIFSELGEDSKALIAYLKAKEYAKDIGDVLYEVNTLSSIAYIKKIHKDFEEAINNYKSILKLLNTVEDNRGVDYYKIIAFMNIADIYLWIENTDEAVLYNDAGLKKCPKTKKWAYYPLLMNKAIIHYQREQYTQCIVLAKQIKDTAIKDQEEKLYITSLFYLGKSAYKLKKYQESIHYLETALTVTSSSGNVNINEKESHEFLALGYNKLGNSEKTSFHFEKYTVLEKKQNLEDLRINNETHELVDVVPLKTEINQLGKKLTKQTKSEKKLVILFVCLLGLFIGIAMYYKVEGRLIRKKFEELLKKVSQLEQHKPVAVVHKKNKAPDQKERMLLDKIADFEKEEYYLSTACNLAFMAQKLETNTSYLSKVINTHKGKSFSNYITELRINTALVRLKNDKKLHSYTIQGIAEEFGFKRQETFARAFKTHTGINPSQYLKNLSKTS